MLPIFKPLKRRLLIRLRTALGFGGMAVFCLSSCQPLSEDGNEQPNSELQDGCSGVKVMTVEAVDEELEMERVGIQVVIQNPPKISKLRKSPPMYGVIMPDSDIVK